MRWLDAVQNGASIPEVIQMGITEMALQEQTHAQKTGALG